MLRVLILGTSGMLGHTLFRDFSVREDFVTVGCVRTQAAKNLLLAQAKGVVAVCPDLAREENLSRLIQSRSPNVIINCAGLVKQRAEANVHLLAIDANSRLPHVLASLAAAAKARLIHLSTDCVFSGSKGDYSEQDVPDPTDFYGWTKLVGEVDYAPAVTIRTSMIGPELASARGLLEWFLNQSGPVKGYVNAIFSGLTTIELSRVIREHIIPAPELCGVYNVASAPISKWELLQIVAQEYGREIEIVPDENVRINRSLNGDKFRLLTGYIAPDWRVMVRQMRQFG